MFKWFRKEKDVEVLDEVGNALKVVVDFDQLRPKPVGFVLHGKKHIVQPVSTGDFGAIYNRCAEVDALAQKKKLEGDALHKAYCDALRPICPTLVKEDIAKMLPQQQNSFFMFVFKVMSGEAFDMPAITVPDEKKN